LAFSWVITGQTSSMACTGATMEPERLEERLLIPQGIVEAAVDLRWHVLQTKSRQEKALAEGLSNRGIKCFLPLAQVNRVYGNRKAKVDLPLFPGYLFLKGTLEDVYLADRTKRVARVIPVFDQEKLGEELKNVELALRGTDGAGRFDPFPYLKRGIRVEVSSGPLRGVPLCEAFAG
jgi:hypothetical protein